jgi:eukaryotic-like serine/threonine-protein kinase
VLFTTAADGQVISAAVTPRGGSSAVDCSKGCTVHEGDAAVLTVSKGPVPDVAGLSVGDATSTLTGKGLKVSTTQDQQFSNDVDKGKVIGIDARSGGGDWRPGDTVTLMVSKGPQPIAVPNVAGQSLKDAMDALSKAGLNPQTSIPEGLWGFFTATATDPAANTLVLPGANVKVKSSGF